MNSRYSNKIIINAVKKITLILAGIVVLNVDVQAQPTRTGVHGHDRCGLEA